MENESRHGRTVRMRGDTHLHPPAIALFGDRVIDRFAAELVNSEKAPSTVACYRRHLKKLMLYMASEATPCTDGKQHRQSVPVLTKEVLTGFKLFLIGSGAKESTVNAVITSVNSLTSFIGRPDLKLHPLKVQKKTYTENALTAEEFKRLVDTAAASGNMRLYAVLFTLACTGIRVSELRCVTVGAVASGELGIFNKGKQRTVLIPPGLRDLLVRYIGAAKIRSGELFLTRNGKEIDRSNLFRELKKLAVAAGVPKEKVYPHNFRHFFATNYYRQNRGDIAGLAGVLGHSSVNTTRIYVNETRDEAVTKIIRACAETLGATRISPPQETPRKTRKTPPIQIYKAKKPPRIHAYLQHN